MSLRILESARIALMALPLAPGSRPSSAERAGLLARIEEAKRKNPYTLSERQAKAILEMRLSSDNRSRADEKLAKEQGNSTLASRSRTSARSSLSPKLLDDVIVMELEEIKTGGCDQATHRLNEDFDGVRSDEILILRPRRGDGCRHHLARRVHQTDEPQGLPCPEARRQRPDRRRNRKETGHPAPRSVDTRLRLLLQRQGKGLMSKRST